MATKIPASPSAIFCATVLRQASDGTWLLMSAQKGGFSRFAYPHATLDDVRAAWRVTIGGAGEDEYSTFRHVYPAPAATTAAVSS